MIFFHLFQEWNWILKDFFNGCLKCFLSVWYSLSSWSMLIVCSAPRVAGPWRSFKWVLRTVHDIKKLFKFCCNMFQNLASPGITNKNHYSAKRESIVRRTLSRCYSGGPGKNVSQEDGDNFSNQGGEKWADRRNVLM